ncbi:MAG: pyruvate, phosphate dikinase [Bradymonadia bacterium]
MRIYTFGDGTAEGSADMVSVLGGKGAGLAAMSRIGVPVPPGFTLPTTLCDAFHDGGSQLPGELDALLESGVGHIEAARGLQFGDPTAPLLVSVRSGAAISMPGMMDTVLNVGLNDHTVYGLGQSIGTRAAHDCYRRFVEMYAETVIGLDPTILAHVREGVVEAAAVPSVQALPEPLLMGLVRAYLVRVEEETGEPFPQDPVAQLRGAVAGVLSSWDSRRALQFRRQYAIPERPGTAVTVQAMVFGNLAEASGTGVLFTRDPNTGARSMIGEFLPNAQGEDVVSGRHTPHLIEPDEVTPPELTLAVTMPEVHADLQRLAGTLERHFADVQDIEFTVEQGKLWLLQTRSAKLSARAAVVTAVELVEEGLISRDEALMRVEPAQISRLLHPCVDVDARRRILGRGVPASPGAVSGVVVFDPERAVEKSKSGTPVILVRVETSTEDLVAMRASAGVLTARGGMTSHAALVARSMGVCCVAGCADIVVNERGSRFTVRSQGLVVSEGTWITLDGTTGEVILGRAATTPAELPAAYGTLMRWADERRRLDVMGTLDRTADAPEIISEGAGGIGLCRTEPMFLDPARVALLHEMVLAESQGGRRAALDRILPAQRDDFASIFACTADKPVIIRLLDLPLNDFLPTTMAQLEALSKQLKLPVEVLEARVRQLNVDNPALGHRGVRLGLLFPEVYEVQGRAMVEAAIELNRTAPIQVVIPVVVAVPELVRIRRRLERVVKTLCAAREVPLIPLEVGVMVELPRACLIAGELARSADFLLFGANDLTVSTFGFSRDDGAGFLPFYLEREVLKHDPFISLDEEGVGPLIELAIAKARASTPEVRFGIAGEQTSDPDSIRWIERHGVDFICCPPHQIPQARLASAQAAVLHDPPTGASL